MMIGAGEVDIEHGAADTFVLFRTDANGSTVPVDNFPGDPQPESGADVLFRGEEWFEDLVKVFGWDARTIIFDHDLNDSAT